MPSRRRETRRSAVVDSLYDEPVSTAPTATGLKPEVRGWLRHIWRKATTEDDWSRSGEPHPWWDRYSAPPMLSFPRFDLSESSYAFLLLARKTPAWREVYTDILDRLLRRHTTYWAAVDWLTQIGPDPDRARYPRRYKRLIPKDLWGRYDVPGWTANGIEPWGLQPDPIGATGNLFFRGFFNLMLGIHREVSGESTWERPFDVVGLDDRTFSWTHRGIAEYLGEQWARDAARAALREHEVLAVLSLRCRTGLAARGRDARNEPALGLRPLGRGHVQEEVHGLRRARQPEVGGALLRPDPRSGPRPEPRRAACFPSLYVVPQNREVAELLYRNAVAAVGWNKRYLPVLGVGALSAAVHARLSAGERVRRPHDGASPRAQARAHRELALLRLRGRAGPRRVRPLLQVRRALPARTGERALHPEGPARRRGRLVPRLQRARPRRSSRRRR